MEDRSVLALGAKWQWQVPLGLANLPRSLYEASGYEVVVSLRGPGICYNRRFPALQGDAIQFHLESLRPLPPIVGDEGRSSPLSTEDNSSDIPILTRTNAFEFGMGWDRSWPAVETETRSCDPVPPISDDVSELDLATWQGLFDSMEF